MQRAQGLDLMRFFAITLVVALHAVEAIPHSISLVNKLFGSGWVGVDCFFVLSGFLIGSQVFKDHHSALPSWGNVKTFWIRRWWRTLPLYFFALFVYMVIKPSLGFPFNGYSWKFFFFLQNYSRIFDFVQSWSLCIEEHFYLFFPIFVFLLGFKSRSPFVWLGFVGISVFSRFLLWHNGNLVHDDVGIDFSIRFVTHNHLDGIAMGVFLARTKDYWQTYPRQWRLLAVPLGLFLVFYPTLTIPYPMPGNAVIWMLTAIGLGFSFILIGLHDLTMPQWLYLPIQKVALWSYGIYIWNSLVIRFFARYGRNMDENLAIALFFLASTMVAIPTYYFIEVPFLKKRDQLLERIKARQLQ